MAEGRYVYTTHRMQASGQKMESIESVIQQHAAKGWRFVQSIESEGTTVGLVFERERDS